MSSEGYEAEVLDLMYKLSDRRQKGKGKEMQGMTKFDREIKKLAWTMQENGGSLKGVERKGTRASLLKY